MVIHAALFYAHTILEEDKLLKLSNTGQCFLVLSAQGGHCLKSYVGSFMGIGGVLCRYEGRKGRRLAGLIAFALRKKNDVGSVYKASWPTPS